MQKWFEPMTEEGARDAAPESRSHLWRQRIALAALVVILIASAGCTEEQREALDLDDPVSATDYTQAWVGDWNGAADHYDARNGQTYNNVFAILEIRREEQDYLFLDLTWGCRGTARCGSRAYGEVFSNTDLYIEYLEGNLLTIIDLTRSGNRITGTWEEKQKRTGGGYDLLDRMVLNLELP